MMMKKIVMKLIRFYQQYISPATQPTCRYHPTCSSYALEAVDKHGALKGGIMSSARILRCNPFVEGGVDKVPDYFTLRRNPENIGEQYLPNYLLPVDSETKSEIQELIKKYKDQLIVSKKLPDPLKILNELVDLEVLSIRDLKTEFMEEEIAYLEDIQVLPKSLSEDYDYFTLSNHSRNKRYLDTIHSYDQGIELGREHPLLIVEKTGIWYTNLPALMNQFLIRRGVTEEDLENNSYYLWMVLKAIEAEK